jgi:hypothetical protein
LPSCPRPPFQIDTRGVAGICYSSLGHSLASWLWSQVTTTSFLRVGVTVNTVVIAASRRSQAPILGHDEIVDVQQYTIQP